MFLSQLNALTFGFCDKQCGTNHSSLVRILFRCCAFGIGIIIAIQISSIKMFECENIWFLFCPAIFIFFLFLFYFNSYISNLLILYRNIIWKINLTESLHYVHFFKQYYFLFLFYFYFILVFLIYFFCCMTKAC